MRVRDAHVVITGGGSGIGAALARRFAADGARRVVVIDVDAAAADRVAAGLGDVGVAETVDVTDAAAVTAAIERAQDRDGAVDLLCANAGMTTGAGVEDAADLGRWQAAWSLNVMAQVHAVRAVLPAMLERGTGQLLLTASAAGLLTSPGDAPYAVTKHASVGLAEWLAVTYGDAGIGVAVLCPMGVETPLLMDPLAAGDPGARAVAASGAILSADAVADAVTTALAEGRFLVLPHPEVGTFWARKAADPDRWLAGMRRLVAGD